jgi:hypothetical protein
MAEKSKLKLVGLVGVALIVAAGFYTVWWLKAAEQAKQTLGLWVEARKSEGIAFDFESVTMEGFPFAFRMVLHSPRLDLPRSGGAWSWRGPERVGFEIQALAPFRISLAASGQHHLTDPKGAKIDIDAGMLKVLLSADGAGLNGLWLEIEKGVAGAPGAAEPLRIEKLFVALETLSPADPLSLKEPTLSLDLRAQGIDLPPEINPPLGPRLETADLRAQVYAPLPRRFEEGEARAWNEAGGTVEIETLRVAWAPLDLTGDGTLALDHDLQPMGSFTANLKGAFETVDVLAKRKLVDAGDAMVAKIALAVLAKASPDPSSGVIRLPLTLQNRALTLGPARLLKLKDIIWPSDAPRP